MRFQDVAGLDEVKAKLISSHLQERVPHAQLFLEPSGGGGLALALAFAQYLFCENRTQEDSCGECSACKKVGALVHPDLHLSFPTVSTGGDPPISDDFVRAWRGAVTANPYLSVYDWLTIATAEVSEGKTKQGNITVRESRQIIRKLNYKSFESSIKVLVLWMAEYLSRESGNALLKLLEEPPDGTYIMLIAHDQNQILPTILSRTQLVRLTPLLDDEVSAYLVHRFQVDARRAADLARLADGNLSAAIAMSGATGSRHTEMFKVWMRGCFKREPAIQVGWVEEFAELSREDQKTFLTYALHYYRESLVIAHHGTAHARLFEEEHQGAEFLAKKLDVDQFALIAARIDEAAYHIERNANARIVMLDLTLTVSEILSGQLNAATQVGWTEMVAT